MRMRAIFGVGLKSLAGRGVLISFGSYRLRMMGKGLKRKFPYDPEGGSLVYESQRQSVLDISLGKFQHSQTLVEPSLRRSVLIANTLRQIQDEIRQEAAIPPATTIRGLHSTAPGDPDPCPLGEAPLAHPPTPNRLLVPDETGDDWMALSSEEDFSLSSAISSILKDLDTVIDSGPQAPPRTPLGSIENLPGEPGSKQESGFGLPRADKCGDGCRPSESAVFGSFEVMRSSYLRDVTLDDLFLDIDTSVYERETCPLATRTFAGATGDELLKYLPALSSSATSPFLHNQNVRDLNELEHIMEILVGS
ncbi:hypothetical protein JZ751_021349 [Albula glossodonta]|uniref:SERTA domain-containing protein n=1 Tax=Albula glossodonta TaxID=121402 RepID=A0A8T2NJW1_9TELE|nr:hypothetical protein JZ751_021349 [Albula glossodonta]